MSEFFPVTLPTACALGAIYAVLSLLVGIQRGRANTSLGMPDARVAIGEEDKAPPLLIAIRRHAQFAEYVPISLLLLLLLELNHAARIALLIFAAMLVISRLTMMIGIGRVRSPFRTVGNLFQWGMIIFSSLFGLTLAVLHGNI